MSNRQNGSASIDAAAIAGELQALRNHVARHQRAGIDDSALQRADAALREWLAAPGAEAAEDPRITKLRDVLGPDVPDCIECEGCRWEWREALRILAASPDPKPPGDETFVVEGVRFAMRDGKPTSDLRLSDPEMKPQMDALKKRIETEPGYARQLLTEAGILDVDGELAHRYGGKKRKGVLGRVEVLKWPDLSGAPKGPTFLERKEARVETAGGPEALAAWREQRARKALGLTDSQVSDQPQEK